MKIIKEKININDSNILKNEHSIVFDIETTGFHRVYTSVYLIGYIKKFEDGYYLVQHFAETPKEEPQIIMDFFNSLSQIDLLISFNGDAFDIPYLNARAEYYGIPSPLKDIESFDIYRKIKASNHILNLQNYKLKTIEEYLGIYREDIYSGKDLINMYKTYIINEDFKLLNIMLLHNKEDLIGLMDIAKILNIIDSENSFEIADSKYILNDIKIQKDLLMINGYTDFSDYIGYIGPISFNIKSNVFDYQLPLISMNYSDSVKCQFVELDSIGSINPTNHYDIAFPNSIYLLKYDKDILHKNIKELLNMTIELMTKISR